MISTMELQETLSDLQVSIIKINLHVFFNGIANFLTSQPEIQIKKS